MEGEKDGRSERLTLKKREATGGGGQLGPPYLASNAMLTNCPGEKKNQIENEGEGFQLAVKRGEGSKRERAHRSQIGRNAEVHPTSRITRDALKGGKKTSKGEAAKLKDPEVGRRGIRRTAPMELCGRP